MSLVAVAPPGNEVLMSGLARSLGADLGAAVHELPDGESRVRLEGVRSGARAVVRCALDRPDPKLLPLVLAARGAREQGARSVHATNGASVAPHLLDEVAKRVADGS